MKSPNALNKRYLLSSALAFLVLVIAGGNLFAYTTTSFPKLSLTGSGVIPLDRIVLSPNNGTEEREFVLPVMINNDLIVQDAKNNFVREGIYSFQFSIQYDPNAVEAIGVQKYASFSTIVDNGCLANNFTISWESLNDNTYKKRLVDEVPYYRATLDNYDPQYTIYDAASTIGNCKTIRVIGTSTIAMNTKQDITLSPLVYIRFKVKVGEANAQHFPFIIKNDTIKFNDHIYSNKTPGVSDAVFGDDNTNLLMNSAHERDNDLIKIPLLPGMIWADITSALPAFTAQITDRNTSSNTSGTPGTPGRHLTVTTDAKGYDYLYTMIDPITVDSGNADPTAIAYRNLILSNKTSDTRLEDITIETDQPWLKVQGIGNNTNYKGSFAATNYASYSSIGDLWFLDNVFGPTFYTYKKNTASADIPLKLKIICDPTKIANYTDNTKEGAGLYTGYVTFSSKTAAAQTVRLLVKFLIFRPANEFYVENGVKVNSGINLNLTNNSGVSTKVVFGTASQATNASDSLMGELISGSTLGDGISSTGISARFFPQVLDVTNDTYSDVYPNGLSNFSPADEVMNGIESRDIRSSADTMNSIRYVVKFATGSAPTNYPVVISWDTTQFPANSQVWMNDGQNGARFASFDMRKATAKDANTMTFTITDVNVKSFVIEYTLPHTVDFVDTYGNAIIQPNGWNFLSLPVRPIKNGVSDNYPSSVGNQAFQYNPQNEKTDTMHVGYGYFLKYASNIDSKFYGTYISKINKGEVKLEAGWNTIGCLSERVNYIDIDFYPYNSTTAAASQSYTREKGVYAYVTRQGYQEVSVLDPGKGYWIKVDRVTYLKMLSKIIKASANTEIPKASIYNLAQAVTIADNDQNVGSLYLSSDKTLDLSNFELPPTPPTGVFDVRFSGNTKLSNTNENVISLQGVSYPAIVSISSPTTNYKVINAQTGAVLGTITNANNSVSIARAEKIKIVGEDAIASSVVYDASSNTIALNNFSSNASVKVYNSIGAEMGSFSNQLTLDLNRLNLISGQYFVKVVDGDVQMVQAISVIK